jgi:hypothetical protein
MKQRELNRRLPSFEAGIATSPQQFGVSHMALSAAEQQFIIDKASEWLDSSFRSIDLSASPNVQARPPAELHDERFAKSGPMPTDNPDDFIVGEFFTRSRVDFFNSHMRSKTPPPRT